MNANENNAQDEQAVHEIPAVPSSDDEGKYRVAVNVNAGGDERNGVREHQQPVRNTNNNVQESNITYHTTNNAQMFHHSNPPNNSIMYANNNNGPQFQPPQAYGCYGPPSMANNNMASFPYAAQQQPHNNLPPNLPQILAHPPTLPMPPPTLNSHNTNNNVGLDAQRQYYEAQMRE